MMSVEEAIEQIENLMSDILHNEGRPIYINRDDYDALAVAKEALEEKLGG